MSLLNILTKSDPTIGNVSFDAVLQDNFEAAIELTDYPVESGVRVNDHRIILPLKYSITGSVSNNPLKITITDFIGGGLSNLGGGVIGSTIAGLSAGFLSGSDSTRASSALEYLLDLMRTGEPFTVDAVDIQLFNMVITKIARGKDPENENALIFVADLQELISLDRLPNQNNPTQSQLRTGDPAKSAVAGLVKKGQQIGAEVTAQAESVVRGVLDIRSIL